MSNLSMESLRPSDAFAAAGDVLGRDIPVASVACYVWSRRLSVLLPALRAPRLAAPTLTGGADTGEGQKELLRKLAEMSLEETSEFIAEELTGLLAEVLLMAPTDLDRHRRIDAYGMDSLMVSELLVATRRAFDIEIPPLELARGGGTIADITELIRLRLGLRRQESRKEGSTM